MTAPPESVRAERPSPSTEQVDPLPGASDPGNAGADSDWVAVEEPLEIRVAGEAVATTMRTPGADRELALGWLYSEGSIRSRADVGQAVHCGALGSEEYGNVMDVLPAAGVDLERDPLTRLQPRTPTSSACGVCGRERIEALGELCRAVECDARLSVGQVLACVDALAAQQRHFSQTGGLHAAAATSLDAKVDALFEDVGRHNAVDKVIGRLLLRELLPASRGVLVVTSRASFEIVQKACMAQMPFVICLSAPTSLAVRTAQEFAMTLIGFVRERGFNVYSGAERIVA